MFYKSFQDKQLSALGFGAMRLPLLESGEIDEEQVNQMVKYAFDHGINYFDTAFPYHGGLSEIVLGNALKQLPREKFFLATKYPGHQRQKVHDPEKVFQTQLEKCGVEYFDFYLLHNLNEDSAPVYMNKELGLVEFFVEKKRQGKIKHLGFSAHALPDTLELFLKEYGEYMEFCQIQLNYLDWTLQDAKRKVELLKQYNLPVWVMEPVRGGKLATLPEEDVALLRELRSNDTVVSWAFRFLQGIDTVTMTLSGMSNMSQVVENIATYAEPIPLNEKEQTVLLGIAEKLKGDVPCTACRYCVDGCPAKLNIPQLLGMYNDYKVSNGDMMTVINIEGLGPEKHPSACIKCGKCARSCPQNIAIPDVLEDFTKRLAEGPTWGEICRQREEAAKKLETEQK